MVGCSIIFVLSFRISLHIHVYQVAAKLYYNIITYNSFTSISIIVKMYTYFKTGTIKETGKLKYGSTVLPSFAFAKQ